LNDLDRLCETIKKEKGVLHVVVANARITELATPSTATPEHYDKTYNMIAARGTFFTIQKAVPLMTAGGSIVTVGSVAYKKRLPAMTVYSSARPRSTTRSRGGRRS
jgi:NAD(P)-dependent dehydrogenase (short-subunit alcohol dehydrogenase family)